MDLKTKIEKLLSEILSDKHEAVVKLRFEANQNQDHSERSKTQ